MYRNKISTLPSSITKLKNCKEFRIEYNNINSIPDEVLFYKGENKMTLMLKGNPLQSNKIKPNSTITIKI